MNKPHDSLQEVVDIFKQGYITPTKAIVWAKALQEWGRFIVGGTVIFLVVGYVLFSRTPRPDTSGLPYDHQNVLSNLRLIVKFLDITKQSINERQELYADLMHTVDMYAKQKLSQENIQDKLDTLTPSLSICNYARKDHLDDLAHIKNPLAVPEIVASYATVSNQQTSLPERNRPPITVENEKQQWDLLCKLCANELQKAQQELAHLLNTQAQTQ